ncbi:MAG: hypothetical protein AB7S75_10710 [Desulfococcaceae bacterium]
MKENTATWFTWIGRGILLFVMLIVIIAAYGCGGGGGGDEAEDIFGDSDFGISARGNEKAANGVWTGKYGEYVEFTITLRDGLIIDYEDSLFRMYSDAGYIGKYSLDQSGNFTGRLNSRAPGAPITVVTDEIKGTMTDSTFTGTWTYDDSSEKVFQCTMSKTESFEKSSESDDYQTGENDSAADTDSGLAGVYTGTFSTNSYVFYGTYNATLKFTDEKSGSLTVNNVSEDFYSSAVTVISLSSSSVTVSFFDAEGDEIRATLRKEGNALKGTWHYTDSQYDASGTINVEKDGEGMDV